MSQPSTPNRAENGQHREGISLRLEARPERRLIRPAGSSRHVVFSIVVESRPRPAADRLPLTLGLVVDRSGSMAGDKLTTAKRAVLALLDQLDERDRVAVVTFDDQVDLLQVAEAVTPLVRSRVRAALSLVEARASTALHEGWLTGCRAIAGDNPPVGLARCLLLTDGLANVGLTDPEQIASEAAGIREHAGIGTSTFGIGPDYDELLLGPLATAGGGQFYHLRSSVEIAQTFLGELGGLLAVAATKVRLELRAEPATSCQVVSAYHTQSAGESAASWSCAIGDLLPGEERQVVVRFSFPAGGRSAERTIRARLTWTADGLAQASPWQEVAFTYADDRRCDAEPRDPTAMHWIGLHHADLARQEATIVNRRGDLAGARRRLRRVARRIAEYAGGDADLQASLAELGELERNLSAAPVSPMAAKELVAESYRRSRGQPDRR
jgi:Ca-activated chloride channel family protein